MVDEDEIRKCWELLPHPPGTVVRMFARNRDDGSLDGDFARNATEMIHFARVNEHRQTYVCPNPCREGAAGVRHSTADVTHWSYLLIDMDPIEDVYDAATALDEAIVTFGEWMGKDFSMRPPLIIDSGRGRQAWIRLTDVVMDTPGVDSRKIARKVNGYWLALLSERLGMCHGCKVDTSTSDLPRPMRMPGTFNQKTGQMARIVVPSTHIYEGIAIIMETGTPKSKLVEPDVVPLAPGTPWQKTMHALTLSARTYLREGKEEPGRHKVCFHTAKKLMELGVSRAEARKALTQANRLRGRSQELSPEEIEHALDTAEGK